MLPIEMDLTPVIKSVVHCNMKLQDLGDQRNLTGFGMATGEQRALLTQTDDTGNQAWDNANICRAIEMLTPKTSSNGQVPKMWQDKPLP